MIKDMDLEESIFMQVISTKGSLSTETKTDTADLFIKMEIISMDSGKKVNIMERVNMSLKPALCKRVRFKMGSIRDNLR